MQEFEILFQAEEYEEFIKGIESGGIYYDYWGILDILINGRSFFQNLTTNTIIGLGTSSISSQGLTVPIYSIIEQLAVASQKLEQDNIVIITDDQIDKAIVFSLNSISSVAVAILSGKTKCKKGAWYNGEKVIYSEKIPISKSNVIKFEAFVKGCNSSLQRFLCSLIRKHPELSRVNNFVELLNSIS